MNKIKFSIKYSKELEIQRVLSTKKKLKWYFDNGYNLNNSALPKYISIKELDKAPKGELIKYINEEYTPKLFQLNKKEISFLLPDYLNKLEDYFSKINVKPILNIRIILTKYGTAGSYIVPNIIVINVSNFFSIGLIRNILHEIIHLHIQDLINKYEIKQWEKEIIVDSVFEKFSASLFKRQNYPINAFEIQKIFNESYPNIELIISRILKIRL